MPHTVNDLVRLRKEVRDQLNATGKAIVDVPYGLMTEVRKAARSWAVNKGAEIRTAKLDEYTLWIEEREVM